MSANMAEIPVEGTQVAGTITQRGGAHGRQGGGVVLLAAALVALLIGGAAIHEWELFTPAAPAIPRVVTYEQQRFLDVNTTWMPAAPVVPAVVTIEQMRFLENNTTNLPNAVIAESVRGVVTSSEQRFWEVNTMLPEGPSSPYMEELTPLPGGAR